MKRIGVIVAMEEEREMLLGAWLGGKSNVADIRISGIGKVNSALCASGMIHTLNLDCIVNIGVAGSISPAVRAGDIVVGERVAYHDVWCGEGNDIGTVQGLPHYFDADPLLLAYAKAAAIKFTETTVEHSAKAAAAEFTEKHRKPGVAESECQKFAGKIHRGLIVTGDQFYISEQEDRRIRSLYPDALACDMESAAIAQACLRYKIPFISIRAISDEHLCEERQKASYEAFWKESRESHFQYLRDFISMI